MKYKPQHPNPQTVHGNSSGSKLTGRHDLIHVNSACKKTKDIFIKTPLSRKHAAESGNLNLEPYMNQVEAATAKISLNGRKFIQVYRATND